MKKLDKTLLHPFKLDLENVVLSTKIYPTYSSVNGDVVKFLLDKVPTKYHGYSIGVHGMNTVELDNLSVAAVAIAEDANACGDIAGWSGDTEQLISEKQVVANKLPLAIVGPLSPSSAKVAATENPLNAVDRAIALDWTQYQIKKGYRYENNGPSQVHHKFVGFYNTTNTIPPFANFFAGPFTGTLAGVKKCDVNDSKSFTNSPAITISSWDPR